MRRFVGLVASITLTIGTGGPESGGERLWVRAAHAQVAPASQAVRVVTAIEPDTILVGQPFVLGVTVQVDPGLEVRFPSTLPILESVEQVGIVDVSEDDAADGIWRGYYLLLAWKAEPASLPEFGIDYFGSDGSGVAVVRPASVEVISVLPTETEGLELRPARPFIEGRRFPWWWVALSLLVAWLAWHSMRRREPAVATASDVRLTPSETALLALRTLQSEWESGRVNEVVYFDRLEAILRQYLELVRGWPAGAVLRAVTNGHRPLAAALRRSALVRFGRLEAPDVEILTATRVCSDWIRGEDDQREPDA